ncbi:MAG: hypothetical protein Udaeo2_10340 [Candidatus Udaeobacter sp.]|nr:MAG: hypothetical protein Udaeo2_10340 [Candidatus Udaeobacter sp.]
MAHRLKFVVLARLILLGLETRDGLRARSHVELKPLPVHFDLARLLFQCINCTCACCQLRFKTRPPQRHGLYLGLDLPDLLLSILKDKKLFQFRMHERTTY